MRLSSALVAQLIILLATTVAIADAQTTPADTTTQPATSSGTPAVPATTPETGPPPHEPGAADTDEPIHLHMPTAPPPAAQPEQAQQQPVAHAVRHKKHRAIAKVEPSGQAADAKPADTSNEAKVPPASKAPAKVAKAPATNPDTSGSGGPSDAFATTVPFSFIPNSASSLPARMPPPAKPGALPPVIAKASPPPATSLPPDVAISSGLVRQSQILFAPGAPNPSVDALDAIRGLAGPLNTALAAGASHIEVIAYGGNRGDHSSDARRLSLKRALAIRQLLIEGGVPAHRIDVRAMGGANDGAAADRVDVFTRA